MTNHIWAMPLTPNAKLVGLAYAASASGTTAELVTMTGLDKAATERAIIEFKTLCSETASLPVPTIKIAPRPVSVRLKHGLTSVMKHYLQSAHKMGATLRKTSSDYTKMRGLCRYYGTEAIISAIDAYFNKGIYKQDANVGIKSFTNYLGQAAKPKNKASHETRTREITSLDYAASIIC